MDLIIVGAGGMGREVFSWLSHEIKSKQDHKIIGFIDDNSHALDNYSYPFKIIDTISNFQPQKNQSLVLAVMEPKIKKNIVDSLIKKGANFYTLIHPNVILGYNVKIGQGCVIGPQCIITCDVDMGDYVFLNVNSTIGHDVRIGGYSSINAWSGIAGNVTVGSECFFGIGVNVIPKRKIGDQAKIGAGSIVINDIESGVTVFGNPAKKIK